jgi:DNA-binding MarR family transcriptional regulator
MRIKSDDTIAGQPILAIRKFLKSCQGYYGHIDTIAEGLKIDTATATQVFQELLREGYIELSDPPDAPNRSNDRWNNTIKGNALASATARKPIKRSTADKLIQEFLQRVEEINNNDYAYRIKRVLIFGSYLSDSPTLGDIDLYIELEDRFSTRKRREEHHKKRVKAASQQGKEFRSYFEELTWPRIEILQLLKNRSPSISIHDAAQENITDLTATTKILFDATDQQTHSTNETHTKKEL